MTEKVRILSLAAKPKDSSKLRLDEEIREIHAKIRVAEFRDAFDLVSRWAVRPLDLLQAFNEVQPHIVHFSGHGSRKATLPRRRSRWPGAGPWPASFCAWPWLSPGGARRRIPGGASCLGTTTGRRRWRCSSAVPRAHCKADRY